MHEIFAILIPSCINECFMAYQELLKSIPASVIDIYASKGKSYFKSFMCIRDIIPICILAIIQMYFLKEFICILEIIHKKLRIIELILCILEIICMGKYLIRVLTSPHGAVIHLYLAWQGPWLQI